MLAALALLPVAPAGASEAANVFGGGAQSSARSAKPASGVGRAATPAAKGAAGAPKVTTKVAPQVTSTPKVTSSTATTSTQESSSASGTTMLAAVIAGVLVLGGIAFVIVRDARSVAPVVDGMAAGGTRNPEGRLRKRRAQAKAARIQRKRHRKR